MTLENTQFLELLERRIGLLGSLAAALIAARTDVVGFNLNGLETRIADQEHLCRDIRSLDVNIDRVRRSCAAQLVAAPNSTPAASHPDALRLRETLGRLREAHLSVKRLNDVHQHLLRRSCLTVGALLNSYRTFAMTYSEPVSSRTSIGERA